MVRVVNDKPVVQCFHKIRMRMRRVRHYAENLGGMSEKRIFVIVTVRKNSRDNFSPKSVDCKPWLEIFLINETDITLKFISWAQSRMLIVIFCVFHYHVE